MDKTMEKFHLDDLEVNIAPTGISDAVGGYFCGGVIIFTFIFVPV